MLADFGCVIWREGHVPLNRARKRRVLRLWEYVRSAVTDEDVGASDEDLSDLTDVDLERDVLDAGPDGSLDDLVDVTEADIMGDELGQQPSRPASQQQRRPRYRISPRYQPPTSMGRSG